MTGKKWLQLQSRNRRKPYLAADDVDHRFINANRKLWRSGTRRLEKLFTHTHTPLYYRRTHVGVFGHRVELEKERALDDLTHLSRTDNVQPLQK